MEIDIYKSKTKKLPLKPKPRTKPLPKAKQNYLEAEETLFQELEENLIGYRRRFKFESTKNWRFDFYIVKLNLLIEIAGSSWAVGRCGKKIANAYSKYDLAEELGYQHIRFDPCNIESGYVIHWIKSELARLENGPDQTIPED
ncbi:hypothetical protein IAE19_03225 [Acinetobacter sp. S40]|uniref:hypothetical protein n=1 Tax=unclassified Acinetobacter TaxID=196816 RepID=UPI00190B594A|nr:MULTISPECIES: hypothetical protein [unclassified Acinetobacter]MBJ9984451.1 hypothetical protein [Acinetobacter sp. S40]MBK0062166.1 hypothetical protein [Acinetobacter sp. S55]MBK0065970.1 hypothetical protein [Acinetobacter sp. S54]